MIDVNCGMIDILTDEATMISKSLVVSRNAASAGVQNIVATAVYDPDQPVFLPSRLSEAVDYLNARLKEENTQTHLTGCHEVKVHYDMLDKILNGEILTLNDYVFIKLPDRYIPENLRQIIFDLQLSGFVPLIVQPENNEQIRKNPKRLFHLIRKGALAQVSALSIIGLNGRKTQKFTLELIEANLAHLIASNHVDAKGGYRLSEAFRFIGKRIDSRMAELLRENSLNVFYNEKMIPKQPVQILNKTIWSFGKNAFYS